MNEIVSLRRDELLVMTLCPDEESILLNKNVLDQLEQPRQVQILINESHGIFESMGMRDEQTAFKALPDKEKDIHDPLQNAAEAG